MRETIIIIKFDFARDLPFVSILFIPIFCHSLSECCFANLAGHVRKIFSLIIFSAGAKLYILLTLHCENSNNNRRSRKPILKINNCKCCVITKRHAIISGSFEEELEPFSKNLNQFIRQRCDR